ncbi:MAG: endonuclease [Bacilli bacterium]|nr:endonuclease [Bacilli bacterium]
MDIDLNDNSESEIRSYYSTLDSMADSERTGTNLLKNLKPILQDFEYFNYDNVWKIYEITDREWSLSPASETQFGTYDESTGIIKNYVFGSSNNPSNDPYVHTLYRNRDENGVTVEAGRIKEWGSHTQSGGTNREHVWCQSRGFKASSDAKGPAGTDIHHLMSGDGYVNGKPHNNNPYGYVDPNNITIDSGTSYSYCAGNIAGKPLHTHSEDQSTIVFEPQDSDKGDIARACFYMVACYNNLSGTDTITQYNPNLTLCDYATSSGNAEASSATKAVGMGILSDLLEWHELDPVDEYEIHRNNLIYNNFQHNRNPFIDFPEWVDYIWGDKAGTVSASPASDAIATPSDVPLTVSARAVTVGMNEEVKVKATTSDASGITWSISDETVAKLSKSQSDSGEFVTVTALKEGSATITASATVDGNSVSKEIALTVSSAAVASSEGGSSGGNGGSSSIDFSKIPIPVWIAIGVGVVVVIILLIAFPKFRKAAAKSATKAVKKSVRSSSKKSRSKKK